MEKSKLDWKTFSSRRRLDVRAWIESKGFKKFSDMEKWLIDRDMEPPKKEEVSDYFKKTSKKPIEKEETVKILSKDEDQRAEDISLTEKREVEREVTTTSKKKSSKKRVDLDTEK